MKKKIIIRDYNDIERIITIPNHEKVIMYYLQIMSGDAILHAIYKDKVIYWDSPETRCHTFVDGLLMYTYSKGEHNGNNTSK